MLRRAKRSKTITIGGAICLAATIYLIYYLLIEDELFPLSISSVFSWSSGISKHSHLFAVGLIPIYLALMIFGTAVFSIFFGATIQRWLTRCKHNFRKKNPQI